MAKDRMIQFFSYKHLPERLQSVSKPFCELACAITGDDPETGNIAASPALLPSNPERTVALRKLLEAKDAAVRAVLYTDAG